MRKILTKVMFLCLRGYLCVSQATKAILSQMFKRQGHLVNFKTKFKMAVSYPKFVNVVELFFQHVSSLCIDSSNMNQLESLDKRTSTNITFRLQI